MLTNHFTVVTSVLGLFGSKLSGNGRVALEATFQFVDSYFLKTEQYQQSLPDLDHEEREAMVLGRAGCLSVSYILICYAAKFLMAVKGF